MWMFRFCMKILLLIWVSHHSYPFFWCNNIELCLYSSIICANTCRFGCATGSQPARSAASVAITDVGLTYIGSLLRYEEYEVNERIMFLNFNIKKRLVFLAKVKWPVFKVMSYARRRDLIMYITCCE